MTTICGVVASARSLTHQGALAHVLGSALHLAALAAPKVAWRHD
ncbi:MAG: hypothetical protein QOI00_1732 [Chloroflexota bacterium]|jgi:hypothetical protein|nr:hypothetical protein [Chloroflexota bacterium]